MGLGRYVVDAVLLEGRSPTELARTHGISRSRIYQLLERHRAGGYAALEPRSRRPRSCAHAVGVDLQAAIVQLRHELTAAGHDCGPHTIAHHLRLELGSAPSVATIWRILARHGLITPQPQKRPRSSFIRFQAELPNELWQADSTHWQLADGAEVEILNWCPANSRLRRFDDREHIPGSERTHSETYTFRDNQPRLCAHRHCDSEHRGSESAVSTEHCHGRVYRVRPRRHPDRGMPF